MFTAVSFAVSPTVDTFENGNIGTWMRNTIFTAVQGEAVGGNPGGYLVSRATSEEIGGVVGAVNRDEPFIGNYAGAGIGFISVDFLFIQTLEDVRLRVRRSSTENGWHYIFTPIGNQSNTWETFQVTFDPTWSDQEAMDNGWVQEGGTGSFSQVWSSVSNFEFRADNASSDNQALGIDNVTLARSQFSNVPTMSQWGLISVVALLGIAGLLAIRRRQIT